jgi:hypothetical protein
MLLHIYVFTLHYLSLLFAHCCILAHCDVIRYLVIVVVIVLVFSSAAWCATHAIHSSAMLLYHVTLHFVNTRNLWIAYNYENGER